ncbi:enoyl-CoA hydratase [Alcaligenes sp. HPC1271]|nr:enoyl-CoA hydratase/isomerase family protein [Alcaligenes sp. HPC1271]EKU28530.1 enoyl-CoA hydratase [Alcaligenes sp. HPC1271]
MIRTHDAGHWLEVILDRPERRNALTGPMYEELADIIDQANQNQKYRALILTGAGEHFCAGNDISELSNVRNSDMPPPIKFLRSLVQADIPLIVAVEGHAVGIGVTLLLHADFVYAARDARLRMPFTALGLCPEAPPATCWRSTWGHAVPTNGCCCHKPSVPSKPWKTACSLN